MDCQVLIIGGGITGAGLARDLALRGIRSLLVEKHDINAGASGSNHGLLHSGARYIGSDPAAARECGEEGELLKKMAPDCIENTGGLFVAVQGDDERYIADFPNLCSKYGIPAQNVAPADAREMEPALSEKLIAAYAVHDASIDPFRLSFNNIAQARDLGSDVLPFHRVASMDRDNGRIVRVYVEDVAHKRIKCLEPQVVVNASGAWSDRISAMVGIDIDMIYSKGALLITPRRIARRVINRLRKASDADIIVPGGTVSILGTTATRIDDPDDIHPEIFEIERIITECAAMAPELDASRYIRAYCGVRPLVHTGPDRDDDDRDVSRGFFLFDHQADGLDNFITITGGKLTTYRLMAEKTADLVCRKLGVSRPCLTRTEPLPDVAENRWTEPGRTAGNSLRSAKNDDLLVCDCEMVPQSVVDEVVAAIRSQKKRVGLNDIGLRSRLGKGSCQGTFCSQRLPAYLYDQGVYEGNQGLSEIRAFIQERWRGQHPVLWNHHMIQADLQEALQCGYLGLELAPDFKPCPPPNESDGK
jgi:glycerol-3-phosphate dehydrogenase